MRKFFVEVIIGTPIALLMCYITLGWPGVVGGLIGCVVGFGIVARAYRRKNVN